MTHLSPSYKITQADWHDFNPVRDLEKICFPKDAWPFWDVLGALTLPQIVRLKAVADDVVIGFIAVDVRNGKGEAWIMTVGVLPDYRRFGVASALIKEAEGAVKTLTVRLHVRISNRGARRLYQNLGYVEYERWPRYYPGGEDAVLMEKVAP